MDSESTECTTETLSRETARLDRSMSRRRIQLTASGHLYSSKQEPFQERLLPAMFRHETAGTFPGPSPELGRVASVNKISLAEAWKQRGDGAKVRTGERKRGAKGEGRAGVCVCVCANQRQRNFCPPFCRGCTAGILSEP